MLKTKIIKLIRVFSVMFIGSICCMFSASYAQMVEGRNIPGFNETFGLTDAPKGKDWSVYPVSSNSAASIMWPQDSLKLTLQLVNNTNSPIAVKGKIDVVNFATRGRPSDIWTPIMYKIADVDSILLDVNIAPRGFQNFDLKPSIPFKFGAYAIVADLGPQYGRQFVCSVVRTFEASMQRIQYPSFCLDNIGIDALQRLGVMAIRHGVEYKPTTDPDFEQWFKAKEEELQAFHKAKITVLFMVGGGAFYHPNQPLGRPRPWLDEQNRMMDTKFDLAWLPSYDDDFEKWVKKFASKYGWPNGPVTAFALWNEPWEGISISGWGADMPRYREIYIRMARAINEVNKKYGLKILVGGCDSHSNALDKLFGDGSDSLLKWFDFCSIHYQGMHSPRTIKFWADRKGPNGRVKIWDTESWVANTDDRVAAVIAANRAAGYDRAMGIYGGNICHRVEYEIRAELDKTHRVLFVNAWPVAASIGAAQQFIGERPFKELLFKNGLPWVMVFEGLKGKNNLSNPDDGTVVVVGDLGEAFGPANIPFRTARGLKELAHEENLKKQLAQLPANANKTIRDSILKLIRKDEILEGATMTLEANQNFRLFDFYGNIVEPLEGKLVIPLDGRGFFLRTNGTKGSFASLLKAIVSSRIEGIEPLAVVAKDLLAPVTSKPLLRLNLTNVLNREVKGILAVKLGNLLLDKPEQQLQFKAHETKDIALTVESGAAQSDNTYQLTVVFDAGADGKATHEEDLHVNLIAKRRITVDGNLDDWDGVLAQTIKADVQEATPNLTEAAWFPFKKFDPLLSSGFAVGYLAYDSANFYFAAKIADNTYDSGTLRFETRNDDEFFYPETSYGMPMGGAKSFSVRWSGTIKPKYSEKYTFYTISDDGVRLWINERLLINNWTDHAPTENKDTITLQADKSYPIKMEYYQAAGGAVAKLLWESASQLKEVVPRGRLTPSKLPKGLKGNPHGLFAEYFAGSDLKQFVMERIDSTVNFDWGVGNLPDSTAWANVKIVYDTLVWPKGVRRYSYRKDPVLPSGNAPNFDNVQIAFNVLSEKEKAWYPYPQGTMPKFTIYQCTDYEYALNKVSPKYGGGFEIWRLSYPNMPHKHFYPRQGKSKFDGPVKDGKLAIIHEGNQRIVEAAIPWSELPHVKKKLDEGQTIKFSFRVNDNSGAGCMELSRGRSVADINPSFHVDWVEHWANELEFAFEK